MTRARDLPNLATNISFSGSNVGIGTTNPVGQLQVSSGPVIIGAATSTGTASQPLQVTGGAYVSGNLGVGVTNPESKSHIAISGAGITTALTLDQTSGNAVGVNLKVNFGGYQNSRIVFDFFGSEFISASPSGSHGMNYVSGRTNFSNHWFRNVSNATQMVMNNSGNLLIGTETDSGTASQRLQVTGGAYVSGNLGIGTTNPTSNLHVQGSYTAIDTRVLSIGEKTTRISGNTASLVYNTGSGNIAICTNPTGDITLAVSGIPTDTSFNDNSITFSVFINQTGTARSCTAVTLNGLSATIRWAGGSLSNAISGVTTTSGMDIYSFTGINTVGSASTTANYYVLGVVNGGYR